MPMPQAGEAQMRLQMLHRITKALAAGKQSGVEGRHLVIKTPFTILLAPIASVAQWLKCQAE